MQRYLHSLSFSEDKAHENWPWWGKFDILLLRFCRLIKISFKLHRNISHKYILHQTWSSASSSFHFHVCKYWIITWNTSPNNSINPGDPLPSVYWYRNEKIIDDSDMKTFDQTVKNRIVLSNLKREDLGSRYIFVCKNSFFNLLFSLFADRSCQFSFFDKFNLKSFN